MENFDSASVCECGCVYFALTFHNRITAIWNCFCLFVCWLRRLRMLCLSMQWLLRLLWPFSLFYWTYAFYWRILFFSPNNNSVSDIDLHWQIFYFILFSWVFRGKPQNKQQKMFNETALIRVNAQVECYRMIQKIGWHMTTNTQSASLFRWDNFA